MPQKTNYAADAGRIAELQQDIRSGALSASALVELTCHTASGIVIDLKAVQPQFLTELLNEGSRL
jgi:hypothetical protein